MRMFGRRIKLFDRVRSIFRNDTKRVQKPEDFYGAVEGLSDSELWNLIALCKQSRLNRNDVIEDIDRMAADPIIQSAMEMIADDATQPHQEKGVIVWIKSEDLDLQDELNSWIQKVIQIDEIIWDIAFNVVKYGEVYLRTFYSDEEFKEDAIATLGDYFEVEDDILNISHLMLYGATVGYLYDEEILPPQDYIHFCNFKSNEYEEIKLKYINEKKEVKEKTFKAKIGSSFLGAANNAFRILDLIENILITARVGKSAYFKIFSVNVGNAGRTETVKIINEVKNAVKRREYFDKNSSRYKAIGSPLTINDEIFIPTRNGVGDVQVNPVGGEVNISDIVDVEYFRNKLYGALKIPKPYLSIEEALPGSIGSTSLTRLDIRYARTVKRVQNVLKAGIRDMIDFYLEVTGADPLMKDYEVVMAKVTTADDADYREEVTAKVTLADTLVSLLDTFDSIDKDELVKYILSVILELKDIDNLFLSEEEVKKKRESGEEGEEGFGEEGMGGLEGLGGGMEGLGGLGEVPPEAPPLEAPTEAPPEEV